MSLPISALRQRSLPCALLCTHRAIVRLLCALAFTGVLLGLHGHAALADSTQPATGTPENNPGFTTSASTRTRVLLPLLQFSPSGVVTGASYRSIPIGSAPADRPASQHADLNLALRSYRQTSGTLGLVAYGGDIDPDAPQMPGIFSDHRTPRFTSVGRVYDWNWSCGQNGCRGIPITNPGVTLLGMATRSGELLAAPSRRPELYGGGYVAVVLYADESRITLKYTRDDNVVGGYTVHLEKLRVDSNLLELYLRTDEAGRRELPGVENDQPLGIANGGEVLVAIRDCGAFMDPRSGKDWWQGR